MLQCFRCEASNARNARDWAVLPLRFFQAVELCTTAPDGERRRSLFGESARRNGPCQIRRRRAHDADGSGRRLSVLDCCLDIEERRRGTLRRADLGLGDDWSWRDFSRAIGAHPRGEGARRRGTLGARSAPRSADGLIRGGALKMKGPETRELLTLLPDLLRGGVLRGRDRRDRALARSPSPCRRGSGERTRLRSASPLRRPLLLLRAR